jgi:hypothetical protein
VTKLFVDECLSSELALMARERGHHEASHGGLDRQVRVEGLERKRFLLEEDWVLVTRTVFSQPQAA